MLLAVIKPPNNAETALADVKHNLYMNTGLLSAWALTPMVPIAVIPGNDIELLRNNHPELPELPAEGLKLTSVATTEGQVCLGSAGLKEFCRAAAESLCIFDGFKLSLGALHLCDSAERGKSDSADTSAVIKRELEQLDNSVLNWKSCLFEMYRTDSDIFSGFEWWKRVKLETVLSLRFPKAQMRI